MTHSLRSPLSAGYIDDLAAVPLVSGFPTRLFVFGQFQLRIARATDRLPEMLRFYRDGLGLELLRSFEDHEGFDGIILGHCSWPYHLEFTHKRGHSAGRAPTPDNLLVFYLPENKVWRQAVERMHSHGFLSVQSFNLYWDRKGETFEDADGYRVVLQQSTWRNQPIS